MTIGESIRYHRKKLNLTQAQLAERLSVTPQAVSKWESGAGLPDLSMAVPLARALGTTTDELLRFGERYREFEDQWEHFLRISAGNEQLLEVAVAALREFHWDKPFLFRAAVTALQIAESSQDPLLREQYLGQAGAHAQLLVEMDPEDRMSSRKLRADIFGKLEAIWDQREQ